MLPGRQSADRSAAEAELSGGALAEATTRPETVFLRLLLFGDKPLLESREPIVIPIYGRGRAMGCLVGKDIAAEGISELGAFLAGQCSCEVKEQNPGYDLLMAVDWDAVFREHRCHAAGQAATSPVAPTAPVRAG